MIIALVQTPVPQENELLAAALEVVSQAHAPYSEFRVGAALLDSEGVVHVGCNVENASYGLTICAERVAVCSAVASGSRKFRSMVIVFVGEAKVPPCGACRQFMAEFGLDLEIAWGGPEGIVGRATLNELLPGAFHGGLLGGPNGAGAADCEES